MNRISRITTQHDSAGDYEIEVFSCPDPKRVIVCAHGGGVRRWDGGEFFYAVAEPYTDSVVVLVDQNQQNDDYVSVNPLPVSVARIQDCIRQAAARHPSAPIVIMAHSMGCGVATFLDLHDVSTLVLVTPAAGEPFEHYVEQYGSDVVSGKRVTSSDGFKKEYTAGFMASIKGVSWNKQYAKIADGSTPVYAFEAGSDDVIGEERLALRDIPFAKYIILDGAKHNLASKPLTDFFAHLTPLI